MEQSKDEESKDKKKPNSSKNIIVPDLEEDEVIELFEKLGYIG